MKALTHHFDPPEGFVGEFGWLCGYSAGPDFLDAALERFTGMTAPVRAHEGAIALVAILDPGNPQISPVEVPGLWHAPYMDRGQKPFRLLHAKVAILSFRHEREDQFLLRLVVSTGNWTRDTLERSVDLAWFTEVASTELQGQAGGELPRRCAELTAAADLFRTLQTWFDCALVEQASESETTLRRGRFDHWMERIVRHASGTPRFFDSRSASLLAQLCHQVKEIAGGTARNRLLMGSGFFEQLVGEDQPAKCLGKIADQLRDDGLTTQGAPVDVFVNRRACQGLAGLTSKPGWTLREGRWAREPDRTLHAKFIFSGFQQSRTDSCGSAWLYLGSGNLTAPGFLNRCSPSGGNLEAGVVVAAPGLEWSSLPARLPVGGDKALMLSEDDIVAGCEFEDRGIVFVAAPVHAFRVEIAEAQSRLVALPSEGCDRVEVVDDSGDACVRDGNAFLWHGEVPRTVQVRWTVGASRREARVPTIDAFGRVSGAALPPLSVEDAWDELTNFPLVGESDPIGAEDFSREAVSPFPSSPASPESRYALRRIMELVERIASTQTALPETEWTRWCLRLEQVLTRTAASDTVAEVRALGLDVLSPLQHPAFVPDFAITEGSPRKKYLDALAAVRAAWAIESLPPLESVA